MSAATSLFTHPLHLGLGGKALPQPEFTGMEWYEGYAERTAADGVDGRLVSLYRFDSDWESWEMHPSGDEVVLCLEGSMTLHQEQADGSTETVTLGPGDYAVNGPGVWHTADVEGEALALFITVGAGTTHRPR
jgi:mannose-6-phosphate isomerase-like protein (cupin superfamily)